jgi:hypothetical protein
MKSEALSVQKQTKEEKRTFLSNERIRRRDVVVQLMSINEMK